MAIHSLLPEENTQINPESLDPPTPESKSQLFLLTENLEEGNNLARQISHFGYQIQITDDLSQLENLIIDHKILAIIIDASTINLIQENSIFEQISAWTDRSIPLIFISNRDDQVMRINTVRAGGIAFFNKPVNLVNLVGKLDELGTKAETKPYRVLIIEDQPTVASYYEIVLKRAGMTTRVVNDPMVMLDNINDFIPDLILMDLYMPEVDGIELAQVIRQFDEYVSTPIVFLSS
jgi:DNA-binding response OmpR family regulator